MFPIFFFLYFLLSLSSLFITNLVLSMINFGYHFFFFFFFFTSLNVDYEAHKLGMVK